MATHRVASPPQQAPRVRLRGEAKYINDVKHALVAGRLTLVIGAGVTLGAIKCGRTSLSETDREERIRELGWKGLLLGGFTYLKDGGFIRGESEGEEYELYKRLFESSTIKTSISTLLRAASFLKSQLVDRRRLPDWLRDVFGTLY